LTLFDPEGTAGEHETTVLEHGATVLAMELVRLKSLIEVELRLGRDVVDELLSGSPTERTMAQAMGLGFEPNVTHRVGVLAASGPFDPLITAAAIHRFEGIVGPGALAVQHGQNVVLLTRSDCDFHALVDSLGRQNARVDFRIGVSSPCGGVDRLPYAHREAEVALRMFDLARASGGVAVYEELGVFQLFAEVENRESVEHFVHSWLGRLVDYDADHGTDLVDTLRAYLALGGSYDITARSLAVHRSTLKYRLRRIREISGHDLNSPDVRFNLELASRARQTLRAIGTVGLPPSVVHPSA
jgi:sugar diacid utilization regulator